MHKIFSNLLQFKISNTNKLIFCEKHKWLLLLTLLLIGGYLISDINNIGYKILDCKIYQLGIADCKLQNIFISNCGFRIVELKLR